VKKRLTKALSVFLGTSFILMGLINPLTAMGQMSVMGTDTQPFDRLGGYDKYETAALIARQGWTINSEAVVLSAGMNRNLVDALAAGPLAAQLNAPILLTDGSTTLNSLTKAEIERLEPHTVYVTSGSAVIKPEVLKVIEAMPSVEKVVPLGGWDQYETSVNIAKEMAELGADLSKVVIASGWSTPADALSVGAIAGAQGMPILATTKGKLPESVVNFLSSIQGITDTYIIGGTAVVGETIELELPGTVHRYAGLTKYDTNVEVLKGFSQTLNYEHIYYANGETFVDALAGVPFAAQTQSPIILTGQELPQVTRELTKQSILPYSEVIAFGGTAAIPEKVLTDIFDILVELFMEGYDHVTLTHFSSMYPTPLEGESVDFKLIDGKNASDLAAIAVTLVDSNGEVLATNMGTDLLLQSDNTQFSTIFYRDKTSKLLDNVWEYGDWTGDTNQLVASVMITLAYKDGQVYFAFFNKV